MKVEHSNFGLSIIPESGFEAEYLMRYFIQAVKNDHGDNMDLCFKDIESKVGGSCSVDMLCISGNEKFTNDRHSVYPEHITYLDINTSNI